MKKVTKYEANDGSLHNTESKALAHENIKEEVSELIRSILPKKYDTCDFTSGGGYIQLTQLQVSNFLETYRELVKRYHKDLLEMFDKNPKGFIGRCLGDSNSYLSPVWGMACRIDNQNKLWGQPYYANNPHDAKQIQLNKD